MLGNLMLKTTTCDYLPMFTFKCQNVKYIILYLQRKNVVATKLLFYNIASYATQLYGQSNELYFEIQITNVNLQQVKNNRIHFVQQIHLYLHKHHNLLLRSLFQVHPESSILLSTMNPSEDTSRSWIVTPASCILKTPVFMYFTHSFG